MLMPTVLRPQYQTIINNNLSANNAGWDGNCVVMAFSTSLLTKTGGRIRITLQPPSSGASLVLASAYVGMAATAPSFSGVLGTDYFQLARESDGVTNPTLTAGGSLVPMVASFRPITSGSLLVSFGVTSGDLSQLAGLSADYNFFFKAADAANAGTASKSGYSTTANRCNVVSKVEVLN